MMGTGYQTVAKALASSTTCLFTHGQEHRRRVRRSCIPYHIPETDQRNLVLGIDNMLRVGFNEEATLSTTATEHDSTSDDGVRYKMSFLWYWDYFLACTALSVDVPLEKRDDYA